MPKQSLTVVIPSRYQPNQVTFLERSVGSIRAQTIIDQFEVTILVGVDCGAVPGSNLANRLAVTFVECAGRSQAAALNAAILRVETDFVAFLEDDDQWSPTYLEALSKVISAASFVSSTQLEFDENDHLLRVNDFPTPSGWFMTHATLKSVGLFNEAYRFHLDNEWLGRLSEVDVTRIHLVESTAPIAPALVGQVRPWLALALNLSANRVQLVRQDSPYPLVRRLVHSGSGMAQIAVSQELTEISRREQHALVARFGRIPW